MLSGAASQIETGFATAFQVQSTTTKAATATAPHDHLAPWSPVNPCLNSATSTPSEHSKTALAARCVPYLAGRFIAGMVVAFPRAPVGLAPTPGFALLLRGSRRDPVA